MNPVDVYHLEGPYFGRSYPQFPTILKDPVLIKQRQKQDKNTKPKRFYKKFTKILHNCHIDSLLYK